MTTRVLFIPPSLNVGCSFCASQAVQVLLEVESENVIEIIGTACDEHADMTLSEAQ